MIKNDTSINALKDCLLQKISDSFEKRKIKLTNEFIKQSFFNDNVQIINFYNSNSTELKGCDNTEVNSLFCNSIIADSKTEELSIDKINKINSDYKANE